MKRTLIAINSYLKTRVPTERLRVVCDGDQFIFVYQNLMGGAIDHLTTLPVQENDNFIALKAWVDLIIKEPYKYGM